MIFWKLHPLWYEVRLQKMGQDALFLHRLSNAWGGIKLAPMLTVCLNYLYIRQNLDCPTNDFIQPIHCLSSACGRCFVCFVSNSVIVHDPMTKHMKHLSQADDKSLISKVNNGLLSQHV